jgi:nitrite reductase/ring-hydroxylating ferredoxin subunit/uncharacterized membrane protein
MPDQTSVDIIAKQNWLEPLENGLQRAVQKTFEMGGEPGRKIEDALHGVWLGDPLHAALTDIPIGCWTAAVVMDTVESITGNDKVAAGADTVIAIGLAGAVASAITGLTDWQHVGGAPRRVGLVHGLLNLSGAALYATSLVLRRRQARGIAKLMSGAGYGVMLLAAKLGGKLVYRHHIGTDHAPQDRGPEEFIQVLSESELAENMPRRAEINGIPIVLVKSGGRAFALAEKCSHLGGPLSEGSCKDGVIQCPWHGSQFSIADGQVIHGPSVHPQVCFDTRIRDGQVEVRRHVESPHKGHERSQEAA